MERLAIFVGLAGLLPFLAGAIGLFVMPDHADWLVRWFYIYSAGILAFMSGIYWPVAMQLENRCYPLSPIVTLAISQVLFLVGGLALLLPLEWRTLVYPVAYLALCLIDVRWLYNYWPRWYRRLRMTLTLIVVLCQTVVMGWLYLR
ncbi:DUF3429 domain-containing protein [Marinobacter daqiaonensis]|uniref:DUF3429 domain-containing protein n=1 Tax=Marinobacter daqiaonensis TaxID=650891 RepID=UPI001D101798|nr:DUF3429 domain-containing protein [Marinobacter daqiaonensis]